MSATTALLITTFFLLVALGIWDCRRTFRRIDAAQNMRVHVVAPVDFAEEIKAYRIARDIEEAGDRRVHQ